MTTYRVTRHTNDILAPVRAFVSAHGVNPNDVPLPADIVIEDGRVTIERFVRSDDGDFVMTEDDFERELVHADLATPWPLPEGTDL